MEQNVNNVTKYVAIFMAANWFNKQTERGEAIWKGNILYLWEKEGGEKRYSVWNLLVMERRRIYLRILNIVFIDLFYFVICATRKVFFYTVIQLLDCFSSAGVRKMHNEWMSELQNIAQPKRLNTTQCLKDPQQREQEWG